MCVVRCRKPGSEGLQRPTDWTMKQCHETTWTDRDQGLVPEQGDPEPGHTGLYLQETGRGSALFHLEWGPSTATSRPRACPPHTPHL